MRAVLYYRQTAGTPPDEQVGPDPLRQHAADRGWEVVAEHVDHLRQPRDRAPGLSEALAAFDGPSSAGTADVLLVSTLAHLGPGITTILRQVARVIPRAGLVALAEAIDTTTLVATSQQELLEALADVDHRAQGEATRAGLGAATSPAGTPRREVMSWDTPRMSQLWRDGYTKRGMARILGRPYASTHRQIERMLAKGTISDDAARRAAVEARILQITGPSRGNEKRRAGR